MKFMTTKVNSYWSPWITGFTRSHLKKNNQNLSQALENCCKPAMECGYLHTRFIRIFMSKLPQRFCPQMVHFEFLRRL